MVGEEGEPVGSGFLVVAEFCLEPLWGGEFRGGRFWGSRVMDLALKKPRGKICKIFHGNKQNVHSLFA